MGTAFKIYLPRAAGAIEPELPAPAISHSLRGSETVLVVEDQDEVRNLLRKMLEARGYRVLVAATGGAALELAATHAGDIDLLVTDVVMPGMSGPEVSQILGLSRKSMRTLFLSGYTDESIVHRGLLNPGMAFLQKPFTADRLASKVRAVLDAPHVGSY